ncbi:unnamed protein product, partial [Durusdinium trenchii]
ASGTLSCQQTEAGWIQMDFPADPPSLEVANLPSSALLAAALGIPESAIFARGRGRFDLLCEVEPKAFDQLKPDQASLAAFECRGVCVTTAGCTGSCDEERAGCSRGVTIDFRSRFFAPRAGIPEDPVTGSAHCMLAPYWVQKLRGTKDDGELVGFQASGRGGVVKCCLRIETCFSKHFGTEVDDMLADSVMLPQPNTAEGDRAVRSGPGAGRVGLSGPAITTLEGQIFC